MATHFLALILKNPSNQAEFIVAKQQRPPKFGEEEYDSYVDSDLWDLPSTPLITNILPEGDRHNTPLTIDGADLVSDKLDLQQFDFVSTLEKILGSVDCTVDHIGKWGFLKFVEEAEFGPGPPNHWIFIEAKLSSKNIALDEEYKWMSSERCLDGLVEVKQGGDRIGPLVVLGLLNDIRPLMKFQVPSTLRYQEYPPGVIVIPMGSRTAKPFRTTNLVVFSPEKNSKVIEEGSFIASADALIMDPGCQSQFHEELADIVASLPGKLIVFITHHHVDHVDGLSVIKRCKKDAILLAHKNTLHRIRTDDWPLNSISIFGGEDLCVNGERLSIIFAPGHTDGHIALLHNSTRTLIVGDHCVGKGSATLDINSGGSMADYFQTTYKFMELSPHALIPMHGRLNLWPKHMLCGYLRNRRRREDSILKAIEGGAETLYDIVANVYSEVDRSLWAFASWNVRVHIDHLILQDKLPKEFSIRKFKTSQPRFYVGWFCGCLVKDLLFKYCDWRITTPTLIVALVVAFLSSVYSIRKFTT